VAIFSQAAIAAAFTPESSVIASKPRAPGVATGSLTTVEPFFLVFFRSFSGFLFGFFADFPAVLLVEVFFSVCCFRTAAVAATAAFPFLAFETFTAFLDGARDGWG